MTNELSKLLTSCLTNVKSMKLHVSTAKKYINDSVRIDFGLKTSGEILDKLKVRDFNATSLSTYDFNTLCSTSSHY